MRLAGKLNAPLALLTTVVVTVEPSFLALTRTPSIRPSSVEETLPLSAVCAFAPTAIRPATRPARLTVVNSFLAIIVPLPQRGSPSWASQFGFPQMKFPGWILGSDFRAGPLIAPPTTAPPGNAPTEFHASLISRQLD